MAKKKLKPLMPSLREKKRYLAFEVISDSKIKDFDAVSGAIWKSSGQFLGDLGLSKAGLLILKDKWNPGLQKGIVRVNNKNLDNLRASMTFIDKIENREAIVKSVGVSAVLKKAESRYMAG